MTTGDVTYLVEELARLTDGVKRLGAGAQQDQTPQSSVQIEQATKPGLPPRITVKCHAPLPGAAADRAQQLYDALLQKYAQAQASA